MTTEEFPELSEFEGGPEPLRKAYDRLRKAHVALTGERDKLLEDVRDVRIAQAGFPKDAMPKQHAALVKHYRGDLNDPAAIAAFAAEEFGYEPAANETAPSSVEDEQAAAEARLTALNAGGARRSLTPAKPAEALLAAIAKADEEGKVDEAVRLRNEYAELTRPKG